jgi:ribosomal protein L40E
MDGVPDRRRCPDCGASNPFAADWCSQCHRRFDHSPPRPAGTNGAERSKPAAAKTGVATLAEIDGSPAVRRSHEGDGLVWTCPACETENPLEASACARCGSPFVSFFARPKARRLRASSRGALIGSAALPGLGHWLLGITGAAIARALLYLWTLGVSVLLLARPPSTGRSLVRAVATVFALSAAAVWVVSFLETGRLAEGNEEPLVPLKALTWMMAGLSGVLFFGLLGAAMSRR